MDHPVEDAGVEVGVVEVVGEGAASALVGGLAAAAGERLGAPHGQGREEIPLHPGGERHRPPPSAQVQEVCRAGEAPGQEPGEAAEPDTVGDVEPQLAGRERLDGIPYHVQ